MNRFTKKSNHQGFTIVELVMVIIIIAIVATLVTSVFRGAQDRSNAAQVQSDLKNAKLELDTIAADTGVYPTTTNGLTKSEGTEYEINVNNNGEYPTFCLTASKGNISYRITDSTTPERGSCAGHSSDGYAVVTNLLTNPSVEVNDGSYRWFGTSPGAGTNQRLNGIGLNGGYGMKKTWTVSPGTSSDAGFYWHYPTPTAGKTYTCSAHAAASVNQQMRARIEYFDSTNARFNNTMGTSQSVTANVLTRLSVTGTVPVGTVKINCAVEVTAGASYVNFAPGNSMWADAAMLTEGSTLYMYADGSSENWVWDGTPHASTSHGPGIPK